jgi:hypothetical protein
VSKLPYPGQCWRRGIALAIGSLLLCCGGSRAATVVFEGALMVTSGTAIAHGAVNPGDEFAFVLSYDDAVVDSDSSTGIGFFEGLVTGGQLSRVSGTGSWNPQGGSFSGGSTLTFNQPNNESVSLRAGNAGGFPDAGIFVFTGLTFTLGTSNSAVLNDSGLGQSFGAQLFGVNVGNVAWENREGVLTFSDPGGASGDQASFTVTRLIPEPGSASLLVLSAWVCMLSGWSRAKKSAHQSSLEVVTSREISSQMWSARKRESAIDSSD